MKIHEELKLVEYFGMKLYIPEYVRWLCVDSESWLHGYIEKPKLDSYEAYWESPGRCFINLYITMHPKFKNFMYKNSLMEIK